jgi:hypothetical protein
MDSERIAEWISAPRLKPFLDASGGNLAAALDLYDWHAKLSAACFHSMHHVEVLLRNAIDDQLGEGHPDEPLTETWLMDFAVLRPDAVKQVITAVERVGKGKQITRGRVIASLSFRFWSGLFGRQYEELWRQQLRHAFPGAKERKDLSVRLEALRRFRNRLAHHDSVLHQPVEERLNQMIEVVSYVDAGAAEWVADSSDVTRLLHERPDDT